MILYNIHSLKDPCNKGIRIARGANLSGYEALEARWSEEDRRFVPPSPPFGFIVEVATICSEVHHQLRVRRVE